ncbi:MAG: haloperoxidase, partial [Flavobacteriaceae bacterium]|nr:haloperoxidase [Flavobacteriaceae bacterium]
MRRSLFLVFLTFLAISCQESNQKQTEEIAYHEAEPRGEENVAYQWGEMALTATAYDTERFKPRPTITSRYLGLIFTAVFDAWSRFDDSAIPVYLENVDRMTADKRTLKNKEIAISYAAFRTMNEYYYTDKDLFVDFMEELGLDPENNSLDPNTPEGIGNLAAQAVIEARKGDGSNQYGEEEGSNGEPYFNYVGYKPVNSVDENVDPNRWQPKYFADGKGGRFAPECLTPYWDKVKTISIKSGDQ